MKLMIVQQILKKQLREVMKLISLYLYMHVLVLINENKRPSREPARRYNSPVGDEIAVLMPYDNVNNRDVVLHYRDDGLRHISELHRGNDPLQYGTDLTQRRTPSRVLGYHSRATRTRSSICIIGLELAVVLALERKMVRAVLKI